MRNLYFVTPKAISPLDFTSMGDSAKRDDPSKIGQFDSGLKYAIALLLRNNVKVNICTRKGVDENTYSFSTKEVECEHTGKKKTLIKYTHKETKDSYTTAFALQLGYNWELWMAYRELYSNMKDEGGYLTEDILKSDVMFTNCEETIIELVWEENSAFDDVYNNRSEYIIHENTVLEERFEVDDELEMFKSEGGYLRIYKNNILVYSDLNTPSYYSYNIQYGELDERRILLDYHSCLRMAFDKIVGSMNVDIINNFIRGENFLGEKDPLNLFDPYNINSAWSNYINHVYNQNGQVFGPKNVIKRAKERPDTQLPERIITSVNDSLFCYSTRVSIKEVPENEEIIEKKCTIEESIQSLYNINIGFEIKVAFLSGQNVVADKHNKYLLVSENFDVEKDFPSFLIERASLIDSRDVLRNLAKELQEKLRK